MFAWHTLAKSPAPEDTQAELIQSGMQGITLHLLLLEVAACCGQAVIKT